MNFISNIAIKYEGKIPLKKKKNTQDKLVKKMHKKYEQIPKLLTNSLLSS